MACNCRSVCECVCVFLHLQWEPTIYDNQHPYIHIYTFIYFHFVFSFLATHTYTLLYVSIKCAVHAYNSGLKLTHKYSPCTIHEQTKCENHYLSIIMQCQIALSVLGEFENALRHSITMFVCVSPLYDAGVRRRLSAFISMQYFQNAIK